MSTPLDRSTLLGVLALLASTPIALAHPLTFAVFALGFMDRPFTRTFQGNVQELTPVGQLVWVLLAIGIHVVLSGVAFALFRLLDRSFGRFAAARASSQLAYLPLVPLALLFTFTPLEANVAGFILVPYYLLATVAGVALSLVIQLVFVFVRPASKPVE